MSATAGPVPTSLAPSGGGGGQPRQQGSFKTQDKPDEVRRSNLGAAKAVADAIRTSLGPKGMVSQAWHHRSLNWSLILFLLAYRTK